MPREGSREVCLYAAATHLGGAERSLLETAWGLHQRGPNAPYRPYVLLPRAGGPLQHELETAGIPFGVLSIPDPFYRMSRGAKWRAALQAIASVHSVWAYLNEAVELLEARGTALIHSNGIKCHLLSAFIGPRAGIPVLWHLRDIIGSDQEWVRSGLQRLQKRSGAGVIANSRATAQAYRTDHGSREARVDVIHNGIDPIRYHPLPNRRFNEKLDLAPGVPIIGIVGVIARWKGQSEFLRMARRLLDQGLKAGFVIIGDEIYDTGAERGFTAELKAEAMRLGLVPHLYFAGFEIDPVAALNGLDILVHASLRPEPFGRVIIEAMGCGVPVVAARGGGVPELIEDGISGVLHNPGDVPALAEAVVNLLTDSDRQERIRIAARERFLTHFSADRTLRLIEECYDRTTGRDAVESPVVARADSASE